MPRLVAFGCSFTYGHGLIDCFQTPTEPGPTPSKFAWPNLLANKLRYDCLNLAKPGSGNFEILHRVLSTKFNQDDLVIIQYSYFDRYNFYRFVDNTGNTVRLVENNNDHKDLLLEISSTFKGQHKSYFDNWLTIQHIELFLDRLKVKNFSFLHQKISKPNLIQLNNFWDDVIMNNRDKALDGKHPGITSHKVQADTLFDKLAYVLH